MGTTTETGSTHDLPWLDRTCEALIRSSVAQNPAYQHVYPYSIQICAVSQKKPINGRHERNWGHVALLLNGVSKDKQASYPRLKMGVPGDCVVVSVNSFLKNVMWLAAEGHSFAFRGDLAPGERLGREQYERTMHRAVAEGVFTGIEIHDQKWDRTFTRLYSLGRNAVDTDFALTFGRHVYSAHLAVAPTALSEVVRFLNALNDGFATGVSGTYRWSPIFRNCAHLVNNALASIGVWNEISMDVGILRQAFHLAVPANMALNLMDLGDGARLADPVWIFRQERLQEALARFNWLPIRHGSIFSFHPAYSPNDLYHLDLDIFLLPSPFERRRSRFFEYVNNLQHHDLRADLDRFHIHYSTASETIKRIRSGRIAHGLMRSEEAKFMEFLEVYESYIETQLIDVEAKLTIFDASSDPQSGSDSISARESEGPAVTGEIGTHSLNS